MNSRDHNTPKLKRRKYLPLLHRYAVSFNGVDEYLTLPLPNNDLLAAPGVGDFYSSGSAIAGWVGDDVVWNSGVSGKTYTETITIPADKALSKTIASLIVGQKYKFKCRYQAGTDGLSVGSGIGSYFVLPDTFSEWNTVSKIFTAESTLLTFDAPASGACTLDWVSVKRDQGLDANKDQEMILYSGDANFNNPTTRWVAKDGSSNQTCALSTMDKAEGTGSLLITSTGVGDATNNYVMLPPEFLESCIAGKKYTKEINTRLDPATLGYGSDLVGGVDFNSPSWVQTDISATKVDANSLSITINGQGVYRAYTTIGKVYKVVTSGTVSGSIRLLDGGTTLKTYPSNFSETFYYRATSTNFFIRSAVAGTTTIDDCVLEIYQSDGITLTAQIGSKSINSGALSLVAGTFTKTVSNFLATASEEGVAPKLYLSGVGNVYVDKLSLTQAYDMWVSQKVKPIFNASFGYLLSMYLTNNGGLNVYKDSANYLNARVHDNGNVYLANPYASVTLTSNYQNISIQVTNAESKIYVNGSLINTTNILSLGKKIGGGLRFGWALDGGGTRFTGQIGIVQIIRFDSIALTDFNPNTYQPGMVINDLGGGVPEVVLHLDPRDGSSVANMLKDYSPKGHTITAVNIDLSNRVVVRN